MGEIVRNLRKDGRVDEQVRLFYHTVAAIRNVHTSTESIQSSFRLLDMDDDGMHTLNTTSIASAATSKSTARMRWRIGYEKSTSTIG